MREVQNLLLTRSVITIKSMNYSYRMVVQKWRSRQLRKPELYQSKNVGKKFSWKLNIWRLVDTPHSIHAKILSVQKTLHNNSHESEMSSRKKKRKM